jgi:hypothetical protein
VAAAYAEIIITEAKNQPVVFTADDHSFRSPIIDNGWWKMIGERPHPATPPPASLIKRIENQGTRNAVSHCASVRKLLDSRLIRYGSEAVDAVNTSDPSKAFMASIETISLPVVTADGRQAVLASSGVSGPLAGGGFLQFLERQADGRWKVSAFSPLWVS